MEYMNAFTLFWENSYLKAAGLPSDGELVFLNPKKENLPEAVFIGKSNWRHNPQNVNLTEKPTISLKVAR